MGRKRKKILKPWCWYCEREFDEEKVLIHHQKSKHFKCHICQKKLYTGPGLVIHCSQVHKETVTEIPNAFPHRNNLEMDIYGTEGIPEKDRVDRERNKGAGEDSKRLRQETGIAFVPAPPGMMPMMSGIPMMPHGHHGAVPLHMMPSQFGMVPPLPPGVMPGPPGVGLPPRPMPPPERPMFPSGMQAHPSTQLGNHDLSLGPPGPPPPLFPSGSVAASDRPDMPYPGNRNDVGYAVSLSENVKLMHPDNEISLEELRGALPRYTSQPPLRMAPPGPPPQGEFHRPPLLYTRPPGVPHNEYMGHRGQPYQQY